MEIGCVACCRLPIGGDRVYVSAGEEVYKIKKSLFKRD